MFRFKTFSIALLILLVGAAAFVGDTILQMRTLEDQLVVELLAGRLASERALREMVEGNVNRSVDMAQDETVAKVLSELSAGEDFDALAERILPYLSKWMEERTPAERPDWLMVIDPQGRVLFRSEAPQERGDSIVSIPLVRHMLAGAALDALWTLDERVYSVTAAATLAQGKIVGGVLLGFRLDERTLGRLSVGLTKNGEMPKFGMAISWNGSPVAKSFVLEQGTRIPTTAEQTPFGDGTTKYHPFPLLTPQRGLYLGATQSTAGWPERMQLTVTVPHAVAFEPLAERQIVILATTLLLLLISLAWGQSINRAVTRPLAVIVEHLSGVQQGSNVGLLPEVALKEPYRRLGKLVNMLISSRSAPALSAAPTRGDDISQILGDSPAEPDSGQDEEFQFPGLGGGMAPPAPEELAPTDPPADVEESASGLAALFEDSPAAPPAPSELDPESDQRPQAELGSADFFQPHPPAAEAEAPALDPTAEQSIDSMAASAFDSMVASSAPSGEAPPLQADVFSAPSPAGPPVDPGAFALPEMAPPADAAAAAPAAGEAAGAPPGWNPERTVMVQVPEELIAASAESASPGMAPVDDEEEYDPGATVVAPISEDMLSAAMAEEPVDPETAHFKDVYEQFIATRRECGESTDELTFDRFLVKLRKNREALIQKYSCRTVRFQVYVKAGKAALKAVPVRD